MPHMTCDTGAIKHIFSGSDVMCPGLTSPGGKMDNVEEEKQYAFYMDRTAPSVVAKVEGEHGGGNVRAEEVAEPLSGRNQCREAAGAVHVGDGR